MNAVPLQNCILFLYREIGQHQWHANVAVVPARSRLHDLPPLLDAAEDDSEVSLVTCSTRA